MAFAPTAVPFSVFRAFNGNRDFTILDPEIGVNWKGFKSSIYPSYWNVPLTLHIEPNDCYYDDRFVAAEMLNDKVSSCIDVTFQLAKAAPKLAKFFAEKGLRIVPSKLCNACCVRKTVHTGYTVDFKLLKHPLQLPTSTMSKVQDVSFLRDRSNRKFVNSIYYGGRYSAGDGQLCQILSDLDEIWYRNTYDCE